MGRLQDVARRHPSLQLAHQVVGKAAISDAGRLRAEVAAHEPNVPSEGLVLEIGAGQSPYEQVDVVVDKYVVDDFERPGEEKLSFAKPLIVADGEKLPFAADAFAYCIAAHVLEHAHEPALFAGEMARVARAGFVQVPSREAELTFGWDFHPWLIDREGDELVFHPRGDAAAPLGELFHEAYGSSPLFRLWFASQRSTFHHSVEWAGELRARATGRSAAPKTAELDLERTEHALVAAKAAGETHPIPAAVRSSLRCVRCAEPLVMETQSVICTGCDHRYLLAGDVPLLLA